MVLGGIFIRTLISWFLFRLVAFWFLCLKQSVATSPAVPTGSRSEFAPKKVQFQNALLCFRSDWSHHPWPKLLWTHINTASDEQRRTANVKLGYGYGYGYELNIVHMFHTKNAGRSPTLHYCIHQRQSQTRQSFIISLAVIPILGVQCIYTWSLKSCSSPGYSGKVSGALPNGETVHSGTAPSSLHVLNTLQLNFLCTRFLIECWKRALLMR